MRFLSLISSLAFPGTNLTYETVIEHLNILDYAYYFKIPTRSWAGIHQGLLTINEIIDKGFDGQHFLIGLGEHLRNLLVCKDPMTVSFLKQRPTIRNRIWSSRRLPAPLPA